MARFRVPYLTHHALRRWAYDCLAATGTRHADARVVADHLVDANLSGHDSHGVLRLAQYVAALRSGEVDVAATPYIVQEMPGGVVFDGARTFGQVVAQRAVVGAIKKARAAAVSAATVRNCYHTGRIGTYTEQIAAEGMVGIVMVNAGGGGQSVAPFGGMARRLATNPISIAVPTGGAFPLVLDIATSVAPEGKLRALAQQRRATPPGWIIDADGRPTVNPDDFYQSPLGALLPLGGQAGYKGFGLGLMIDVLAGALSGAGCCREEVVEARDGMLIIALDIARFGPTETFCNHVHQLIAHVKSSPPAPGHREVFVPGELEHRQRMSRLSTGICIDDASWQQLLALGRELGVVPPDELVNERGEALVATKRGGNSIPNGSDRSTGDASSRHAEAGSPNGDAKKTH